MKCASYSSLFTQSTQINKVTFLFTKWEIFHNKHMYPISARSVYYIGFCEPRRLPRHFLPPQCFVSNCTLLSCLFSVFWFKIFGTHTLDIIQICAVLTSVLSYNASLRPNICLWLQTKPVFRNCNFDNPFFIRMLYKSRAGIRESHRWSCRKLV